MNYSKKLLFTALCLTALFLASSSGASVTIKGKPLDEIDDIVSIATDGGTAELKKYSLGVIANEMNNFGDIEKYLYVQKISGDNTAADTYREYLPITTPVVDPHSGMHVAASSISNANGRAVLWVEYNVDTDNGKMTVRPSAAFVKKDGSVSAATNIERTVDHEKGGGAYDQDVDSGIFLPDDTNEYFAVAMLKNSHTTLTGDLTCSANIFIIGMNLSGDQVNMFDTGVIIEKDMKQGYSPVSVAAGDFMGTGTTDQIAFTTASSEGITMTVCQITKDSDGKYSYKTLKEENVCTYTGRMKEGYIGHRSDYYPSAETVAGDFDGDGNKEIAVVYKDDADDKNQWVFGRLNITVYKWNKDKGSFDTATQARYVNYQNAWSSRSEYGYDEGSEEANFVGLKAVRADMNGEGRDGIAVLLLGKWKSSDSHTTEYGTTHSEYYDRVYPYFTYVFFEPGTINPLAPTGEYFDGEGIGRGPLSDHSSSKGALFGDSTKGVFYYYQKDGASQEGNDFHGDYPYVDRTFTLASGPFTGQLGTFKMIDDLAVTWTGKYDEDPRGRACRVLVFRIEHRDSDGRFMGVVRGNNEVLNLTNNYPQNKLAVIGADFLGEGVELESPVHLKIEGDRTYAAILQTPPYHVDNIPVPWNPDPTTPVLTNFTYTMDLQSSYNHESTSETGQDINFDMQGSAETIEGLGTGEVSDTYVKVASFALEKAGAKDAGAIIGMLADKVETTKSESDESSITMSLTDKVSTTTSDTVLYYSSNVHVWRYPIKEPAPSWLLANLIEGDPTSASGDKFLTFSMADDPVFHVSAGLEDDNYQPLHEEGNLFSYPTNVAMIPGYENRQLELTGQSNITYSPGSYTRTVSITQEAASSTTEARKVNYGVISSIVGAVQVLHGDATENSMTGERGNSATFTKSYSTSDTLIASFPDPTGDYANLTFTTAFQAYADEAGILTLGFAIDSFGAQATLWQNSIYNQKPDPALYMPYRYYFNDNEVAARTDELIATKLRGLRFYIPDLYKYTDSTLYAGGKYSIEVPIYNASFVAPNGSFEVALSYRDKGSTETTLIEKKSLTIGGWEAGKESNKAVISFDWTVPNDITEGAKELVVEIDPDNNLDEIHEGWDPDTPGGNNTGYFPFSVVKSNSLPFNRSIEDVELELTINGMSMSDFITYAAGQSEPFDADCVISNKGSHNILASLELNLIASDDKKVESFTHNIGVMKNGETHSYKFLALPEKWRNCKELQAIFYTDSGIISQSAEPSDSPAPSPEPDIPANILTGSSGGCDMGLSVLSLVLLLPVLFIKRKL